MRLAPHWGVWQRLMLLIGGTVALMWLGLALTSETFARFQTQFSGLAASQVPRIALTGELAGHSAQLAGLTTRIIGGGGDPRCGCESTMSSSSRSSVGTRSRMTGGALT